MANANVKEMEELGELSRADVRFLLRCRELDFGLFDIVVVKGGSPVLARRSEPQEKFD